MGIAKAVSTDMWIQSTVPKSRDQSKSRFACINGLLCANIEDLQTSVQIFLSKHWSKNVCVMAWDTYLKIMGFKIDLEYI